MKPLSEPFAIALGMGLILFAIAGMETNGPRLEQPTALAWTTSAAPQPEPPLVNEASLERYFRSWQKHQDLTPVFYYYLVSTRAASDLLWQGLFADRDQRVVVAIIDDDEATAARFATIDEVNELRMNNGLPPVEVIDLR